MKQADTDRARAPVNRIPAFSIIWGLQDAFASLRGNVFSWLFLGELDNRACVDISEVTTFPF